MLVAAGPRAHKPVEAEAPCLQGIAVITVTNRW